MCMCVMCVFCVLYTYVCVMLCMCICYVYACSKHTGSLCKGYSLTLCLEVSELQQQQWVPSEVQGHLHHPLWSWALMKLLTDVYLSETLKNSIQGQQFSLLELFKLQQPSLPSAALPTSANLSQHNSPGPQSPSVQRRKQGQDCCPLVGTEPGYLILVFIFIFFYMNLHVGLKRTNFENLKPN